MKKFQVSLLVNEDQPSSEVVIKTNDAGFGEKMVAHVNRFEGAPTVLSLKTTEGYQRIQQESIYYIEVFGKEVQLYLKEGHLVVRQSLASIEELLDSQKFVRVSKSALINVDKLKRLEMAFSGNYYGFLQQNYRVVISRRYFQQLKQTLNL